MKVSDLINTLHLHPGVTVHLPGNQIICSMGGDKPLALDADPTTEELVLELQKHGPSEDVFTHGRHGVLYPAEVVLNDDPERGQFLTIRPKDH